MPSPTLRRFRTILPLVASAALVSACGSGGGGFGGSDGGPPHGDGSSPAPDRSLPQKDAPDLGETSTSDVAPPGSAIVYAETKDTLYALDPITKAVTTVAAFTGCTEVLDIALDKDSNMFATTLDGLFTIDTKTAKCTLVASGSAYPNSLSFVPAGTLDPMVEALVGYVADTYVRIDTKSGKMTMLGSIGQSYSSSGDIVSARGGGTYLTVKGGPKGTCNDCLIQVDPKTGAFLLDWGPLDRTDVFGLAFWGGAVYGFDTAGELFEVEFHGLATQITTIPDPGAPAGLQWFGAGSTTSAPIVPVK
jgi:hypothetical protein